MAFFKTDWGSVADFTDRYNIYRLGYRDVSFLRYVVVRVMQAFPRAVANVGIALIGKYGNGNMNMSRCPIVGAHWATEGSITVGKHVVKGIMTGEVRQHDWGTKEENMRRHGTPDAKLYNFKSITSKYLYIQTFNDAVKNQLDAAELRALLPDDIDHYMVPDKNWHHMSYMFSIGGKAVVYDYLIDYIRKLERAESSRQDL